MTDASNEVARALKPCPFCGSETAPYLYGTTVKGWYGVCCDDEKGGCDVRLVQPSQEQAIVAWNTRSASKPDGEVEYEVWQKDAFGEGDAMVAGPYSLKDAKHYAAVYSQDGPAWVVEVTRRPLVPGTEPTPSALARAVGALEPFALHLKDHVADDQLIDWLVHPASAYRLAAEAYASLRSEIGGGE